MESDGDNNTSDLGVILTLSKAHSSGETSTLYGRKLSRDDFGGEGHPFQLTQPNSLYIWENKILAEEKIRVGSVVKYRKVGNAFVYQGNTRFRRQVKFYVSKLAIKFKVYRVSANSMYIKSSDCNPTVNSNVALIRPKLSRLCETH